MTARVSVEGRSLFARAYWAIGISYLALFAFGLFRADSGEQFIAYFLVLSTTLLPSVLWLRLGAPGIPVLPAVSLIYIAYFAWPVLRNNENTLAYTLPEIEIAAATVAMFLFVATIIWWLIASSVSAEKISRATRTASSGSEREVGFVLTGMVVGIVYNGTNILGWLDGLSSWFGLVRSIANTFIVVSCFLLGSSHARGTLRGRAWVFAIGGLLAITALAWSSLFLVGGLTYLLAAVMGYVLVSRRVPYLTVVAIFAAVAVLHSGKSEMRNKYWLMDANFGASVTAGQLPGMMLEWIADGLYGVASGDVGTSLVDRASLIQMILLVQAETPGEVDYLRGDTYAMLPSILVPRFIDPNKPASQIGMDMLSIRYGVLSAEATSVTAVGWGLVAEAYANFGYLGVAGMALLLGAFCGVLGRWSSYSEPTSLATLVSIAALMTMVNVEADFIQLFTTLMQSCVAAFIFSTIYNLYVVSPERTSPTAFIPGGDGLGRRDMGSKP